VITQKSDVENLRQQNQQIVPFIVSFAVSAGK